MRHSLFLIVFLFAAQAVPQSDQLEKLRALREKGTPAARLELIEKALPKASDAEKPIFLMEKALVLEAKGSFDEALKVYESVLQLKSNLDEYAHLFSARLAIQKGDKEKARTHFEKILTLSPNLQLQSEANYQIARLRLSDGKFADARKLLTLLEKRQRSEKVYPEILWDLAKAERGLSNQVAFCKWVKKLFVQNPESPLVAGWGTELATQEFEGKRTNCSLNLEERKKRIKNLQWAGVSKRAWDEIEELRKVPGEDPFDVTMLEALYHLHEGEVSDAMKLLLPYYEKKKTHFSYLTTLATAAARSGESQLAVGSYYAASKLSPRSQLGRQALYQSAFLSYQFQDYDGASRRFQEFMKLYPTSGLAKDARWHMAWIRYLRGDYEGAYKALSDLKSTGRRGRKAASQDRIDYWMAMAQYRQGQYADARKIFETIVKEGKQSYYSLASQQRLKKVNALIPKPALPVLTEQSKRLSRFAATELLISMDEEDNSLAATATRTAAAATEETESEENLLLNPLSSENELADNAEEGAPAEQAQGEPTESDVRSAFASSALVKRFDRAQELISLGLGDWAKWDLYDIERKTSNREYLKKLMNEYERIDQFHRSASIAQNAFAAQRHSQGIDGIRFVWEHAYPLAYKEHVNKWTKDFAVPTELVWGIMKAESSYKRDVVSPVGAIGLMQIMPYTGTRLSGLLKEKGFTPQNLFEPAVSVRLGTKYLQRLMKQFDQNIALTAAGYNAGPHRVKSWLASFGQLDLDEFVEHIPFLETRNYVKKVVSNAWVYNQLYGHSKEFFPVLSEPLKIRFQTSAPSKETWEDI